MRPCVYICKSGHLMVRELGDNSACRECDSDVFCWNAVSGPSPEPDNMSESMRTVCVCEKLLDQALSQAESVLVDNKPSLRREMAELKDNIRRSLRQTYRAKEEIKTGRG